MVASLFAALVALFHLSGSVSLGTPPAHARVVGASGEVSTALPARPPATRVKTMGSSGEVST